MGLWREWKDIVTPCPALRRALELDQTFTAYYSIAFCHLYLKEYQEA